MNDNPQTFASRIAALEDNAVQTERRLANIETLGTLILSYLLNPDVNDDVLAATENSYKVAWTSFHGDSETFHPAFQTADGRRVERDGSGLFDLPEDYTTDDLFPQEETFDITEVLRAAAEGLDDGELPPILSALFGGDVNPDDLDPEEREGARDDVECDCAGCRAAAAAGSKPIRTVGDILAANASEEGVRD